MQNEGDSVRDASDYWDNDEIFIQAGFCDYDSFFDIVLLAENVF